MSLRDDARAAQQKFRKGPRCGCGVAVEALPASKRKDAAEIIQDGKNFLPRIVSDVITDHLKRSNPDARPLTRSSVEGHRNKKCGCVDQWAV